MSLDLAPVLAQLDADRTNALERLGDFLRIPSISTDPARNADTRRAGQWAVNDLRSIGFNASLHDTAGHPMVVGHIDGPAPDAQRVLFYGHYDVQPADPLELWESPPFEPRTVSGPLGDRIVARGAVDDKGQVMTFFEACRAWRTVHGVLPCAVTVFLEGEEESGSPSFMPFLQSNKELLRSDVCVVSDTGMWDVETPAITTRLRGLVYLDITIHGPSHDLHSGMYGGAVPNPCDVLAGIIAQLHDSQRRVTIPGFYDGVQMPQPATLQSWKGLPDTEAEFLGGIGLREGFGETGYSLLERVWARPTLEVNGMSGGYTGPGAKTVIGAKANAKLSCRLVPGQDPGVVENSLKEFIQSRLPAGCRMECHSHGANPAICVQESSRYLEAAERGLGAIFGRPAFRIGSGGSVPAVGMIASVLGVDTLLVGFGLDDDRVHSPNEKFEVACFANGARSHAAILAEIGKLRA
ncbi:MAG: M20/M25/M40 family metallo-hydrolase [Planctomycetota bacterium]|nr:M20/M25/M40 family metallo-hydrolase [Planctomycetota bacterium]MDA1106488.1 M20/M25/M40 family metallo-hydrolase [Planctomycetota bacterium]